MKTLFNANDRIEGIPSFFYVFPDGRWEFIRKTKNMILYSGSDMLAKQCVGTPKMHIAGMYMEYDNVLPITAPVVDRTRTPAYYEALAGTRGYMRVPLTAAPGFASSDPEYLGNTVTVQAQTNGTFENGPGIVDGDTNIFAAALVIMPVPSDKSEDILFSAANSYELDLVTIAPIPKIANAQVGVKWDLKFT